ncbi:DUF4145 domain-containing protein [Rhodococcus cerastii]|uniref:DUF4145 domain-containing protein n=1 Tax=Rhodococcus erythropolis TaxID=1833 RepID=UPI001F4546F3|nr:DUF4145 domain-containing protein [Rhodococcus erythropolis]MCD2155816.1 DUF4145 domain-containing protein [Rhodococcus cerastii]UJC78959.1 DUF4145 domain-containing protein [Rhodococcus erythropolis]
MNVDVDAVRKLCNPFNSDDWPHLVCPSCGKGRLIPPKEEELAGHIPRQHTAATRDIGEPEDTHGTFYVHLSCNLPICEDWAVATGDCTYVRNPESWKPDWSDFITLVLRVRTMYPPVGIVSIPEKTPDVVVAELNRAASVTWIDPRSAVTTLRVALERLMDAQDVRRGKLDLDGRIKLFTNANEELGKLLLAVKHVGNGGAHRSDQMSPVDVVDMAEFIGIVLEGLYDTEDRRSAALARAERINQNKRLVD